MNPWSKEEVEAIVADYFLMLCRELKGESYSKMDHRNRLVEKLTPRNAGSVQKKYQTISAALLALNLPYIRGYKPLDNYQTLLIEQIDVHLEKHPEIVGVLTAYAERSLLAPVQRDLFFRATVVDPPEPHPPESGNKERLLRKIMKKYTFVTAEANNSDLEEAGKGFVLDLERARLREEGSLRMADRIEQISAKRASVAPYDILSYECNEKPLFIKVKTTSCGMRFPFSLSAAELAFSAANPDSYRLYRLFDFPEAPRLFILKGRLYDWIRLIPESFLARVE